jgi:CheY-like chemotaxis protein
MGQVKVGEKPLVLIVEDYDDSREMYAELLELHGFRVAQAVDGQDAIDMAFSLVPDVIVMDLSLPRVDGREATRRIKADARTAAIPVILVSGMPESTAPSVGDVYVTKPCPPDRLVKEVRRVLK